ncbi:TPA: MarR family transcriptional regulator [Enterococcus faecium]|nr:MarR family transcriptional regulator [Enterococcus faecium]
MKRTKTDLTIDILKVSHLISRHGSKIVSDVGLSSIHQWVILRYLATRKEVSIGTLKDELMVTKQNMTGMINRLKELELVSLVPDTRDGRKMKVSISPKGKKLYDELWLSGNRFNDLLYQSFDEDEIKMLEKLSEKLILELKKME